MTLFNLQSAVVVHGISEVSPSAELGKADSSVREGTSAIADATPKACRQEVVLEAFCKARFAKEVSKGNFVSDAAESASAQTSEHSAPHRACNVVATLSSELAICP